MNNDKKGNVKRIWQERFADSREWMDMVFSRIYSDRAALTLEVDGETVSSLLLRDIDYYHLGRTVKAGYIYGAATSRRRQGRGYMSRLLSQALNEARERSMALVLLKPAKRYLYDYYGRKGFATVIYIDEQRYTSAAEFKYDTERFTIETSVYDIERFTNAYNDMATKYGSTVMHDANEFKTILIDNSIDRGYKSVVIDNSDGHIAGMAIAVLDDSNRLAVHDLTVESPEARQAALAGIKAQSPDSMIVIEARPERTDTRYESRGMARIVNVDTILDIIAAQPNTSSQTIRVTDPIIAANNGIFKLGNGKCERLDNSYSGKIDLDVTIDVLTAIIFSAAHTGNIFMMATTRPWLSLMLD